MWINSSGSGVLVNIAVIDISVISSDISKSSGTLCDKTDFVLRFAGVGRSAGMGLSGSEPMGSTGKFKRGAKPESDGSRIGFTAAKDSSRTFQWSSGWSKKSFQSNTVIGKSVPQVALIWLLQKNVVSSVIIGATSIKQLEDNMGAGKGWALTTKEMDELDKASSVDLPYPYEVVFRINNDRKNPFLGTLFAENIQ
ncbi:uncharacterized protein LOC110456328 [Mizuhopecten yessoensis]|uniref:uncharacterized protein LOC110456328 n=1 Tax=Mizuhopecten yessoensis TaxID=6573 RepID=UPI000B45882F|nr:uncharacterized protein LOC110456328 [Mizuhopecten yessoensis]